MPATTSTVIQGIKKFDEAHLWTGHFDSTKGDNWSSGNGLYKKYMDLDGLYVFDEKNMGANGPQYKSEISQYNKGRMIFRSTCIIPPLVPGFRKDKCYPSLASLSHKAGNVALTDFCRPVPIISSDIQLIYTGVKFVPTGVPQQSFSFFHTDHRILCNVFQGLFA
jgi:hypothetical protein